MFGASNLESEGPQAPVFGIFSARAGILRIANKLNTHADMGNSSMQMMRPGFGHAARQIEARILASAHSPLGQGRTLCEHDGFV